MYVKAKFFKPQVNGYSGLPYLFETKLPLTFGSKVLAPSQKGDCKAIVTEINVSESEIKPEWADRIKSIVKMDDEGGTM